MGDRDSEPKHRLAEAGRPNDHGAGRSAQQLAKQKVRLWQVSL
jgi:hypothetical protein